MDGTIAQLDKICELAEKYNSLVMIDESHCSGFMGKTGRGTHEHHNVMGKIDIITGTLGKALGGASGGFTSGRKEIIDMLQPALKAIFILQYTGAFYNRCINSGFEYAERNHRACAINWKRTPNISAEK